MTDAHAHLHLGSGTADLKGVRNVMCTAVRREEWNSVEEVSRRNPGVVPYYGIHPWHADTAVPSDLEELPAFLGRCWSGIGEIGLDKVRKEVPLAIQRKLFTDQLRIAVEMERPVNIHCVRAWGLLVECLDEAGWRGRPFIIHAFNGPKEMIKRLAGYGARFSFAPFTLKTGSPRTYTVFKNVPPGRLLLDTDFPQFPGQNLNVYGSMLRSLYRLGAAVRGTREEDLMEEIGRNGSVFTNPDAFRAGNI